MRDEMITTTGIAAHGASRLPWVEIDSFNLELKDEEGFLGDRANKAAFWETLEEWRKPLRKSGEDPFGNEPSENISKKDLDAILAGDDAEASAVVHSAVEDGASNGIVMIARRTLPGALVHAHREASIVLAAAPSGKGPRKGGAPSSL